MWMRLCFFSSLFCFWRLFLKDSNEVVDYFGERTVEGFSKFIDSNGQDNGKIEPAAEEVE